MSKTLEKIFILFLIGTFVVSCAKTDEQLINSAIDEARHFLTNSSCSDAKKVLDDVGFQEDDSEYISVYASAQACESGYKELDLFNPTNIGNISSASLIQSLAGFSSSNITAADTAAFTAVQNAITTLLSYDGTTDPDTTARNTKFGASGSGDLSLQALYMIFFNMGKHFHLYGNASDANGAKGGGGAGNSCIFSYTTNDAVDWIGGTTPGTCVAATGSEGSDLLEGPVTAAVIKRRLCEGIFLFNNMMDILTNVTLPGSDQLGDISGIQTALSALLAAAEAAETGIYNDGPVAGQNAINTLKTVRGQATCEAQNLERIEKWYAIFFETIYQ